MPITLWNGQTINIYDWRFVADNFTGPNPPRRWTRFVIDPAVHGDKLETDALFQRSMSVEGTTWSISQAQYDHWRASLDAVIGHAAGRLVAAQGNGDKNKIAAALQQLATAMDQIWGPGRTQLVCIAVE